MGPEQPTYKLDEILAADTLLIGRVAYESFAGPVAHGGGSSSRYRAR